MYPSYPPSKDSLMGCSALMAAYLIKTYYDPNKTICQVIFLLHYTDIFIDYYVNQYKTVLTKPCQLVNLRRPQVTRLLGIILQEMLISLSSFEVENKLVAILVSECKQKLNYFIGKAPDSVPGKHTIPENIPER